MANEQRIITYREAINEGLRLAMREDERVFLIGEDQAGGAGCNSSLRDAWGGPFGVTKGLFQEFGPERVIDTPISEMAFVGAAVGAAMTGMRPIVEIMFVDLVGCCYDQIANQAAKMHYMMGGKFRLPLVIRTAYGTHDFKRSYGGGRRRNIPRRSTPSSPTSPGSRSSCRRRPTTPRG